MPVGKKNEIIITRGHVSHKKTKERAPKQIFNPMMFVLSGVTDVGFAIVIPMLGGVFLGGYLDKRLATTPKLTLSFLLLGIIVGIINVYRLVARLIKNQK